MMNQTVQTLLNHRTIREFTEVEVPKKYTQDALEAAIHTASSTGMQTYSMIHVSDPAIKKRLAEIGGQEYIARIPELYVFIVDAYRNAKISEEKGEDLPAKYDMDRFFKGFTDGSLAAQSMCAVLESYGLGTIYLGSIKNDVEATIEALKLPKGTFPIVALGYGYPNQEPQMKPRMPLQLRVFENEYKSYDNYLEAIKDYDQEMQTYYDLRDTNRRVDSFSNQVVTILKKASPKRSDIVRSIQKQGFDLKL